MSKMEWRQFFNYVDRIVNDGRPWQEKVSELYAKAEVNGSAGNLLELVNWKDELDAIAEG